jgi:DNA-binding NtrC family response regulator
MSHRLLLVEPRPAVLALLSAAASPCAKVDACATFPIARACLMLNEYTCLITNLRLEAYNGLHLVYIMRSRAGTTRSIVYTQERDVQLARDVQQAGAFYESLERVAHVLPAYFQASLPPIDRRDPSALTRRISFRGGRRSADLPTGTTL